MPTTTAQGRHDYALGSAYRPADDVARDRDLTPATRVAIPASWNSEFIGGYFRAVGRARLPLVPVINSNNSR
jgi:hypothetical protein